MKKPTEIEIIITDKNDEIKAKGTIRDIDDWNDFFEKNEGLFSHGFWEITNDEKHEYYMTNYIWGFLDGKGY